LQREGPNFFKIFFKKIALHSRLYLVVLQDTID
jgi:hypothetical protein